MCPSFPLSPLWQPLVCFLCLSMPVSVLCKHLFVLFFGFQWCHWLSHLWNSSQYPLTSLTQDHLLFMTSGEGRATLSPNIWSHKMGSLFFLESPLPSKPGPVVKFSYLFQSCLSPDPCFQFNCNSPNLDSKFITHPDPPTPAWDLGFRL